MGRAILKHVYIYMFIYDKVLVRDTNLHFTGSDVT